MKNECFEVPILRDTRLIISQVLGVAVSELSADSEIGSVSNWDSLSNLKILFEIEAHFKLKFDLVDLTTVRSVKDWARIIDIYIRRGEDYGGY